MKDGQIDTSSKITNCSLGKRFKCYRNVVLSDCEIGDNVVVGDDTTIVRCRIGDNVGFNRRSYFNDSCIGSFTYSGSNTTVNYTEIGKFCSLARNVDIGGFDHNYHKVTTMPMFRFKQLRTGEKPDAGARDYCIVGNDVWIAAGAQVLHKVRVGDGAIVGGGAVVTKDVPPYAIVAGVPAKIIKYRFSQDVIDRLLKIKWWDWPQEILLKNIDWMISEDLNEETLSKMEEICRSLSE